MGNRILIIEIYKKMEGIFTGLYVQYKLLIWERKEVLSNISQKCTATACREIMDYRDSDIAASHVAQRG